MTNVASCAVADDAVVAGLNGAVVTHVFQFATEDTLGVAIATLQALRDTGASLDSLHLGRRRDARQHTLRVTGLPPSEARRLAEQLAALPGVQRATVEHEISARR